MSNRYVGRRSRASPRFNGLKKIWLRRLDTWIEWPVGPTVAPVPAIAMGWGYAPVVLESTIFRFPSDYPAGWAVTLDGEIMVWPLADAGQETSRWFCDAIETHCASVHPLRLPSAYRRLAAIETAILEKLPRVIPLPTPQGVTEATP